MKDNIKPITEVLGLLSEHLEALRPSNNPTLQEIAAAKTTAHVVDSYLAAVMTCLEYADRIDQVPNLEFMQIGTGTSNGEGDTPPPMKRGPGRPPRRLNQAQPAES